MISAIKKFFGKEKEHEESDLSEIVLNQDQQGMIQGIVDMAEKTAKDIMVPRTDVCFLPVNLPGKEILRFVAEAGFSRIPVYEDTIDNVIGILHVKDTLRYIITHGPSEELPVKELMRKPYFIPETYKINALLKELRRKKVHLAVVVDEYGGVSGITCLEDIIEEIVGDIQDEFDNEPEEIQQIDPYTYICDTRTDIVDLNEKLDLKLPHEDFDTLGGFVFDIFGKVPVKNDSTTYNDITFTVQNVSGIKIKSVKIELPHNS
ncbi:MAG: hemolysin family protein [Spirochaetia bacterium]|nr:hemolysin family protein [Spirochaetia bacterium]